MMIKICVDGSHLTDPEEIIELLRSYQRAVDVNIISSITDTNGTILHANDKFCEVSKYDRQELVGENHRIINSGYHPKSFFEDMWHTIKSGKMWHGEIMNKAKDGTYYWVDTVILPIKDKAGNIKQHISLRTLINEKKRSEYERKEYIDRLSELLHITSHRVRAPLATCLGLVNLVETDKIHDQKDLLKILQHMKSTAQELDSYTKELTLFIADLEKKYRHVTERNQFP